MALPQAGLARSDSSIEVVRDAPVFKVNGLAIPGDYSSALSIGDRWRQALSTLAANQTLEGYNCLGVDDTGINVTIPGCTIDLKSTNLTNVGTRPSVWSLSGKDVKFLGNNSTILDGGGTQLTPPVVGEAQFVLALNSGGQSLVDGVDIRNNVDEAFPSALLRVHNQGLVDSHAIIRNCRLTDGAYSNIEARGGKSVTIQNCWNEYTKRNSQNQHRPITVTVPAPAPSGTFDNVTVTDCTTFVQKFDDTNLRPGCNFDTIDNLLIQNYYHDNQGAYDPGFTASSIALIKGERIRNASVLNSNFLVNVWQPQLYALQISDEDNPDDSSLLLANVQADCGLAWIFSTSAASLNSLKIMNCKSGLGRAGFNNDDGTPASTAYIRSHIKESRNITGIAEADNCEFKNTNVAVLEDGGTDRGYATQVLHWRNRCKFHGNNASSNPVVAQNVRDASHVNVYRDAVLSQDAGQQMILAATADGRGMCSAWDEHTRYLDQALIAPHDVPVTPIGSGIVGVRGALCRDITSVAPNKWFYADGPNWEADT